MKITLRRQTTWGCVRYFSLYKNGTYQGKLFNNIATELEVDAGDKIEFREGLFQFSQKMIVSPSMTEITITNSKNLQPLFLKFITLFLLVSFFALSIHSLGVFLAVELVTFLLLNHVFRHQSYQFQIEGYQKTHSFSPYLF
ncbi:hypothetical protein [Enterococcus rivorum]|uniref:Uncharacterized protein n=1 Tax=Enterococcus rivorum TaxID=762845 RepID=A0A1E5KY47_9ENTE|nr:hypothetical protein [Enterococcus rivorum]MBP2099705.1 hypothetical protein [Enterococcus rivorum]OEH82777.1 hypothetical protein BCR26_11640 [Enterococcus rivorum]